MAATTTARFLPAPATRREGVRSGRSNCTLDTRQQRRDGRRRGQHHAGPESSATPRTTCTFALPGRRQLRRGARRPRLPICFPALLNDLRSRVAAEADAGVRDARPRVRLGVRAHPARLPRGRQVVARGVGHCVGGSGVGDGDRNTVGAHVRSGRPGRRRFGHLHGDWHRSTRTSRKRRGSARTRSRTSSSTSAASTATTSSRR